MVFTGPGIYRIVVAAATGLNLNLWQGGMTDGTVVRHEYVDTVLFKRVLLGNLLT